jgi:hypothetical protein
MWLGAAWEFSLYITQQGDIPMTASWSFTGGYPLEDVVRVNTDRGLITVHYHRETELVAVLQTSIYDDLLDYRDDFQDMGPGDYNPPMVEAACVTVTVLFDADHKDSLSDYEGSFDLANYCLSGRRLVFALLDEILARNGYTRTSHELI